jgi:hypothetical protein
MTVSGLTRSSAERQSFHNRESPTHRTRSANGDAAYAYVSNAARPEADAGVQESLLAEQRGLERVAQADQLHPGSAGLFGL